MSLQGVLYEHKSIPSIVKGAGLKPEQASGLPALVVAWSSQTTLLRRPEFASLSLTGVRFLQLPATLDRIREHLEWAAESRPAPASAGVLGSRLGQWHWALEQIQLTEEQHDRLLRLRALCRFAAREWPGWLEQDLAAVQEAVAAGTAKPQAIANLAERANTVSVLDGCRPLVSWKQDSPKRRRVIPLENALAYGSGESAAAFPPQLILERASRDPWWRDLEADVQQVELALEDVRRGGFSPVAVLGDGLDTIAACIRKLSHLDGATAPPTSEEIVGLRQALDTLVRTIDGIVRMGENARSFGVRQASAA